MMGDHLERKYGLFTAICMVVGIVIGSGVFFKAQTIQTQTGGNMPMGILAWIIGGMIMMACLLTFSVMGQRYERVNGLIDYAEATVGSGYGYLMGWFCATIYFPGMTSALIWVSARYTMDFILTLAPDLPMLIPPSRGGTAIGPECVALALFYLCGIYALNVISPERAGRFQTGTTVVKLIPLLLMAVGGVFCGLRSGMLQENWTASAQLASVTDRPLLSSVCSAAFAYEGWIIATAINAEIKDSRKNLPLALAVGGIVIVGVYLLYYLGIAGGATNQELMDRGAQVAFTNVFGSTFGNGLNLVVAISCLGTTNGLMLACTRCMYALAERGEGPDPELYSQLDKVTNMPSNSSVFALLVTGVWFLYFYLSNLARTWSGPFVFDSTELPVISVYMMYLPMLVQWMRKERDQSALRRFVLPGLACCGSVFMVFACVFSHGWGCLWYLIVFAVIMAIGVVVNESHNRL